jgi:ketosteroid isomerase-like protein
MKSVVMTGAAALALVAFGARAQVVVHGPPATAAEILKAERGFDAMSGAEGKARAFRAYMDPVDGREFAGGDPKRGDAIYQSQGGDAPEKAKLRWTPDEVFASTGDMGVTWGHWTLTPLGADKPAVKGHYVTVWRKNADGQWKGIIDIGNAN